MTDPGTEPIADLPKQIFRVRAPADLIEAVPYLLGFHPRQSLVVVGLDDKRVVVTARSDLSAIDTDPSALPATVRAVAHGGATSVVGVIYEDDDVRHGSDSLPRRAMVAELRELAEKVGADLVDALLVSSGRWWSYVCADERCCPAKGRPLAGKASLAAATATYAGLVALPDRADLAAQLASDDDEARWAMLPELDAAEDRAVQAVLYGHGARHERSLKRAIFAAAREVDSTLFLAPGAGRISDPDVARYATGLAETAIRDAVWLAIDQGRLNGRPLWRDLARRVPPPYDAPPLFLFGWAEWRSGNGPLAGMAAERALASDPTYTAADLLLGALTHGLDPRRTPRLRMPKSA
ncbi:MAG: DUF4192 domain-containing protein [Actinomycetota bacterium]